MTVARERAQRRVAYPTSDGKPMAETDKHRDLMFYFIEALKAFFALSGRTVYVSGNNFLFWEEGNPKARVSPDCYVVFDVTPEERNSYMAWKEGGRLPAVVFEFTSRKTQREDTSTKFPLYEQVLRVPEYFQFDPTGDYLHPRLQGYRLGPDGRYVRLELTDDRLYSEQIDLDLVMAGETLRLYDPAGGRFLPTLIESEAQRAAVEQENERLRAELEALRRQIGRGGQP